jgi:hypothetical protein
MQSISIIFEGIGQYLCILSLPMAMAASTAEYLGLPVGCRKTLSQDIALKTANDTIEFGENSKSASCKLHHALFPIRRPYF